MLTGVSTVILGYGYQKRHAVDRDKRLRAKRVAFDKLELVGKGAGTRVKQADPGAAIGKIEFGQIMIPPATCPD